MTKEQFYDAEIYPLMDQIIRLAESQGIPFVASFQLEDVDPDSDCTPLQCTTSILPEGTMDRLLQARRILMEDGRDEIIGR